MPDSPAVEEVEPGTPSHPSSNGGGDMGVAGALLKPPAAFGYPGHCSEAPGQGKTGEEEGEETEKPPRKSPPDPPPRCRVRARLAQVYLAPAKHQFLICNFFN